METIKSILKCAKTQSNLTELINKAQQLQKFSNIFACSLPADLIGHCKLAKLDDNVLAVTVDSSSWATRLHYAIPEILKNLSTQPEFKDITKISYRVDLKEENFQKKRDPKKSLSSENEKLWRDTLLRLKRCK